MVFGFFLTGNLFSLTIKMGSLAPANSPWDKSIKKLASEWKRVSNGKINLTVFPGGIAGDEADMIRKIRLRQLDAAAISAIGINQIYKGVLSVSAPLLVRNLDEFEYVLTKVKPVFEEEIEKKQFKVVIWAFGGWVRFFSRKPAVFPDEMKSQKLWIWQGNSDEVQLWKQLGFTPVPLSFTDVMTSLQSGIIDAFASVPVSAAAYQWFGIANNMSEMQWAPMLTGIIMSSRVWNKIDKDIQSKLLDIGVDIAADIKLKSEKAEAEAISIMKKYGLVTHPASREAIKEWEKIRDSSYFTSWIKSTCGMESFELVKKYLDEFRKKENAGRQ